MGLLENPVYCVEKSTSKFNSTLIYDVPVYLTSQMMLKDISKEIVYLKSIHKTDGATETHVFNNTNGETLTKDYLYFVKVTDLQGNVTVEESRIYSFDEFPHTKVYGMCDAKCKVEVPTKEQFDEFTGRFAVVDLVINETLEAGDNLMEQVKLPKGFTSQNCCIISTSLIKPDGLTLGSTYNETDYSWKNGNLIEKQTYTTLLPSVDSIQLRMVNLFGATVTFNYTVRYLLYRYK